MRVVTGGLCHETSTFTTVKTTLESYTEHRVGLLRGEELLKTFHGTNTVIGGFIESADKHGFELVPTMFANAHPSAPTRRDVFDSLVGELADRIRKAGKIDGVLLELHGAMVAEGTDDGDASILEAVREAAGPDVPVLSQLDIHSNMSQKMISLADVLLGRRTYPEIDQAERARDLGDILVRIWNDGVRPTMALHQIPMVWGMNQVTAHTPMSEAIAKLLHVESQPGVICASIATCFPLANIPDLGSSVYVVTDNDKTSAQKYADELGEWIYARREDWHFPIPSTAEALKEAEAGRKFPVIFADLRDNTGGGSPGDSTGTLKTFLDAGLEDACVLYIVDPAAIAECQKAGVGATITLDVGAKSTPLQGEPVRMTAEVVALSNGEFRYAGPRNAGLDGNMGPSAYIRQDGVHVLLVTEREQPYDTAFARSVGLQPQKMRYVAVKSAAHFRQGFESWAGAIYEVSEPSVHNPTTGALPFTKPRRKLYPLDSPDFGWGPAPK